jgi:hypothetical protein
MDSTSGMPSNKSLERTRDRQSAKLRLRRARRSTQPLERAMRNLFILSFTVLVASTALGDSDDAKTGPVRDRAVVLAALEDFANWDKATFGPNRGVLAIDSSAGIALEATAETIRAVAPKIREKLSDELVASFLARNREGVPSFQLVDQSAWAKPKPDGLDILTRPELPEGIKAVGSFTFPGFSGDGTRALLQIHHSWSMHGAIVTYVLARKDAKWRVVARDQMVYP